jgi:predicted nuclease of predicted toxin-antitoxin system
MKFLVDENIPHSLVNFLKSKNHQIIDLKNSQYRGFNDLEILKISEEKGYIILTFDKDFLVLRKKGSKLKCLILNLKTINIKYLTSYLEMIFKKYKKVFKRKTFLIYCKKEEVIII